MRAKGFMMSTYTRTTMNSPVKLISTVVPRSLSCRLLATAVSGSARFLRMRLVTLLTLSYPTGERRK